MRFDRAFALNNSERDSATNAAATVTLAATSQGRHVVYVVYSYDGTPTGSLTITDGGNTRLDVDITDQQVHELGPFIASPNSEVVVTLAAGSAGVTGKLNVFHTLD